MNAVYSIWLLTNLGERVLLFPEGVDLDIAVGLNDYGAALLTFSPEDVPFSFVSQRDLRLAIYRTIGDRVDMVGDTTWLVVRAERVLQEDGRRLTKVLAYSATELLRRRWVVWPAGSSQSSKSGAADDIIVEIVNENLGPSADTGSQESTRNWSDLISISPSLGAGPSITKGFAWRNVLTVLQEICENARELGTPVYFDITAPSEKTLSFQTYVGLKGSDTGLTLSPESGSIRSGILTYDFTEEKTAVYAAGAGQEEDRIVVEESDLERALRSPFGRIEVVKQATQLTSVSALEAYAQSILSASRPRVYLDATLQNAPGREFGIHFRLGDKVNWSFEGAGGQALIKSARYTVKGGDETINITMAQA